MAQAGRIHAPAPGAVRVGWRKLDASGPIAPQISALRRAVRLEKPLQGTNADPARPGSQTLISRWNLVGCHWDFEREKGPLPSPQNGSALHHLVTAVSVKKKVSGLSELFSPRRGEARTFLWWGLFTPRVKIGAAAGSRPSPMTQIRSNNKGSWC